MEWDAGAFMRVAIGIFFLLFGLGIGYALLRLGGMFGELSTMVHDVNGEVVPILNRVQTTVDEVNSELSKIDEITGSVVTVTDSIGQTSTTVQRAITGPVKRFAAFSAGVEEGLSTLIKGRRKEA
jgi:ABC-type transporter Mla subunit MlaD